MICVLALFCSAILQPAYYGYVPLSPGVVSEFEPMVFVAHSYLDGQYFQLLTPGMVIVYRPDLGEHFNYEENYRIVEVISAPAETPASGYTRLMVNGVWRDGQWIHENYFHLYNHLALMTCTNGEGGRVIVLAERVELSTRNSYN